MKKIKYLIPFLFIFLIGCVSQQGMVTPVDRSLNYVNQYEVLEATYKNQYNFASEKEKEWLSEKVAPIIDQMRLAVIQYSQLAVLGDDAVETRLEIIRLARMAALKLTEEVTE